MAKVSLAGYLREKASAAGEECPGCGPFLTISRQFGCYGFSLGLLLQEILNEDAAPPAIWKVYNREILERLAKETDLAAEIVAQYRAEKPSLVTAFFRGLSTKRVPTGDEIRTRITTILRGLAIRGHAILIGQGGATATSDLPHGISLRLEAPLDWRIAAVAAREGVSADEAAAKIEEVENERAYLRRLYQKQSARMPAFHLTFDCSILTLTQIAQLVVQAMRFKGLCR
jgi:hypothetical protein